MTTEQFWTSAWRWDPWVVALSVAIIVGYAVFMRCRFSPRSLYLVAGVAVLLLTLVSPLNTLADGYLFSAHMLQHLLLQLVAPPLILLAIPVAPLPKVFSRPGLRSIPQALERPLFTWLLGLGAMWIWHLPALCTASMMNPSVHWVLMGSLLVMGGAFWWPIIGPWSRRRLTPLLGVLYLFSACVFCTILGIILTFAPPGLYPMFLHPHDSLGILPLIRFQWGLTFAQDQQLGGLLMWVPPCFVYLCGIFGLLARWYAGPDPELLLPPSGFEALDCEDLG